LKWFKTNTSSTVTPHHGQDETTQESEFALRKSRTFEVVLIHTPCNTYCEYSYNGDDARCSECHKEAPVEMTLKHVQALKAIQKLLGF